LIVTLNGVRREHRALQRYTNLRFHPADDPHVLFYSKTDGADVVLVAVNLDPFAPHSAWVDIPIHELGIATDETYRLHERLTDTWQEVRGARLRVTLDPQREPAPAVLFSLHRT
jgi:starch synthase (maltosyl-transferring)